MKRKGTLLISLVLGACLILAGWLFLRPNDTSSSQTRTSTTNVAPENATTPKTTSFNKTAFSTTDPTSLWVVVNKQRPLQPISYAPTDLVVPNVPVRVPGNESMEVREVTAKAIEALFAGAKADGVPLMLSSGYRSYSFQTSLYNSYVTAHGQSQADTFSARPGYSEHQTGLAFDVEPLDQQCDVDQCFADLPAGKWIADNAYKYGFLLRYPVDKVSVTGYEYEPWHLRYVGKELALELHNTKTQTLEEFFGLPAAPDYN